MCRRLWTICCAMYVLAVPAFGQTYEVPELKTIPAESMLWEWLFGLTFLVGCLVVAFKPAKRSNLH